MKKIGLNVFTVNELSESVKEKVLDRHRYDFNDLVNYDIQEYFSRTLDEKGYPTNDIRYRLNYCQGDGVAFYGEIDLQDFIEKRHKELEEDLTKHDLRRIKYIAREGYEINIEKSNYYHMYDHFNTMIIEQDDVESCMSYRAKEKDVEDMIDSVYKLVQFIKHDIKVISKELEDSGYSIAEGYESDENLIEYLTENEYYFTEDGIKIDIDNYEEII